MGQVDRCDPGVRWSGAPAGRLYEPARLAAIYAAVAGLWIVLSDLLVAKAFRDPRTVQLASSLKGLVFVAFTAALLFALARRLVTKVERSLRDVDQAHQLNGQSQRLIEELLDSSPDAIFTKDLQGRYTLVNREVERVLGKSSQDIVGRDDASIFPPEQAGLLVRHDRAVMDDDHVLRTVEHLSTVDGDISYLVTKGPLHAPDGHVIGLFGIARDVTERESVKEALTEALDTLRESQEIAGIGSYLLNFETGIWESSAFLDSLLGINGGYDHSVAGWLDLIDPADRGDMADYFAEAVVGRRQPFEREYRIVRPADGTRRWVQGLGRLEVDADGRLLRMRGTIQDITTRVEAEATLRESEGRFRAVVEQSIVAIYIIQDGVFCYVNRGFAEMLGFASPAEVAGQVKVADLVCEHDRSRVAAQIARGIGEQVDGAHLHFTALHRDGTSIQMEVFGQSFVYQGRPAVLGVGLNITDRKRAEEDLRIAAIAFEAQDGVVVTDPKGMIRRVNKAFCRITGYDEDEAVGKTPAILQSGCHDAQFYANMWTAIGRDGYWQGELINRHKNGSLFTERLTISAVKDPDGKITHYVGSLTDVTQQREAESRAQHLASFDALTDLPNRMLLYDRIEHALSWSARSGGYCALLFVDLDNFKKVNDTIGHHAGDKLLVQASRRMKATVREGDTVARFGGDEFIVLLEELGDDVHAAGMRAGQIAEKLRRSMTEQYDIDGQLFYCTASIGATLFVGGQDSAETILIHADLAMYRAKQDGRNTLRFFEEGMQIELARRTALEAELRVGIERGQFVLHYQPQYDRDSRVVGAEALLRWNHPTRGLLGPAEFISLAEETGVIVPLGQWVMEAACAQIAAWAGAPSSGELVLAVNVSARQFAQPDFVDKVLQALGDAGASPTRLKIEITETIVLDDVEDAFRKMKALKNAGVTFSLDDFGTGSSSLSYLTRLPLDQLKIDKSFVDDLPQGVQDAMVAHTIIVMAKGLGLHVVAEGVETDAQWAFLMQHGCDAFQGFRFSRPVPVDQFEATLRA